MGSKNGEQGLREAWSKSGSKVKEARAESKKRTGEQGGGGAWTWRKGRGYMIGMWHGPCFLGRKRV